MGTSVAATRNRRRDHGESAGGDFALTDINRDGRIDLSDPVSILGFLFLGREPPVLGTKCVRIAGYPENCQSTSDVTGPRGLRRRAPSRSSVDLRSDPESNPRVEDERAVGAKVNCEGACLSTAVLSC
jgi:hypothetical protein